MYLFSDEIKTKKCIKCGKVKPINSFYKHKAMKDGHLGKCIDCCIEGEKIRRQVKKDVIREYDRGRNRNRTNEYLIKYRKLYPEKDRAHSMVARALKSGKLIKPSNCTECGSSFALESHHEDYSKPLCVEWLCSACHKKRHYNIIKISAG